MTRGKDDMVATMTATPKPKGWIKPPTLEGPEGDTLLCKKGYGVLKEGNEALVEYLKDYCTVKPRVNPGAPGGDTAVAFPVWRENSARLYLPRAFGLEWFGEASKDRLSEGEARPNLRFHGGLRPEQHAPVDAFLEAARDPTRRGGIISVGCGFGKTVLGLYLAAQLGRKTMVICHKDFLINQWRERIAQYIPEASVGILKAKRVDVEDKDIVLASLQSLAMKEYDPVVFEGFGFVIADEAHHLSAEVFSQALPKVTSRYMLGLSATLDRKDGLRKVFEWFLGRPVFQLKKRADAEMVVEMIRYYDPHPDYGRERVFWNGKKNVPQMINAICSYTPRNEMLLDALARLLAKEPGRRVLILSDRRNHLVTLDKMIRGRGMGTTGFYVGGMKEEQLKESEGKDIILATLSMVSEGFDVPVLNTLVLASPVASIEQPSGRIQRQRAAERTHMPYTIDIWDTFSIFQGQGRRRLEFYRKQGYEVIGDAGEPAEEEEAATRTYQFIADEDDAS
jgi:superfamily II DNA or RNA helicase